MHHAARRTLAFALVIALTALAAASAADWPRFRGPNGAGISADTAIPVQFKEGNGILWEVPIPGKGNSSAVISHGKLFTQSASDDGKERFLLCLDAATGKTLWTRNLPGVKASMQRYNTLASSTPAVDDERVYSLWWTGTGMVLTAHNFAGESLWDFDLGPFRSEHGAGTSPVEYGGRVFVNYDQDRIDSRTNTEIPGAEHLTAVYAFDAKTGKVLWRKERKGHRACYSAPILRETSGGGHELIVLNTNAMTAYDPATGAVNWNWDWDWSYSGQPYRTVGSPVIWKDMIFAQAGDGDGASSHFVAVRAGAPGSPPKLVWEKKKGQFPYVPSVVVVGDHIFAVHDKLGIATCCECATGKVVWSQRIGPEYRSSPICVDGKIYVCNDKGDVTVYLATTEFKLLAKNPLGERILATPAVADGRMYIRGASHLFCIGKPGG